MDPDVARIAEMLAVLLVFGLITSSAVLMVKQIYRRDKRENGELPSPAMRVDDSRFERLERAVDAIALEVERMSEAQRFTAKLMTERPQERLPVPGESTKSRADGG
jgi:hypothetical protein